MTGGGTASAEPHQFGVDLSIKSGVPDKVDDPPLRLLRRHVELVCQHAGWRGIETAFHIFKSIKRISVAAQHQSFRCRS